MHDKEGCIDKKGDSFCIHPNGAIYYVFHFQTTVK